MVKGCSLNSKEMKEIRTWEHLGKKKEYETQNMGKHNRFVFSSCVSTLFENWNKNYCTFWYDSKCFWRKYLIKLHYKWKKLKECKRKCDFNIWFFSPVTQSCLTICDPMDCSMQDLPVHHQLPGLTQTHVLRLGDAIQPSHPLASSPFSSCLQSFPASGSFPTSQFFASGGQSIGVSASTTVLPMNTQDWSPLR